MYVVSCPQHVNSAGGVEELAHRVVRHGGHLAAWEDPVLAQVVDLWSPHLNVRPREHQGLGLGPAQQHFPAPPPLPLPQVPLEGSLV